MSAHKFLLFSSLLFLHLYWFVIFYTTTTNSQSQWLSPVPTFSRSFLLSFSLLLVSSLSVAATLTCSSTFCWPAWVGSLVSSTPSTLSSNIERRQGNEHTNLGYPWRWHSFLLSATALTGLPFTLPLLFWFSLCFIFSLGRLVVWPFVLCNNSNEH